MQEQGGGQGAAAAVRVLVRGSGPCGKHSLVTAACTGKYEPFAFSLQSPHAPPNATVTHQGSTIAFGFGLQEIIEFARMSYHVVRSFNPGLPEPPWPPAEPPHPPVPRPRPTSPQDQQNAVRELAGDLHGHPVLCLVFSLVIPSTFVDVQQWWLPAVRAAAKMSGTRPPTIVLVGTMLDLVDDPPTLARLARFNQRPVTHAEALELVEREGLHSYAPVSAKLCHSDAAMSFVGDFLSQVAHAGAHQRLQQRAWPLPQVQGQCVRVSRFEVAEPLWLGKVRDREWKERAVVALLMCRHDRLGQGCCAPMRELPDEMWAAVFACLQRL